MRAIGISGKDGGLLKVEKKYSNGEDIGFVGEITDINVDIIRDVLEKGYIPVISTIGCDKEGNIYNINGDTAAARIAETLSIVFFISFVSSD